MSEEQFKQHIEALAVRRLEKSKKMSEEAGKLWNEIVSHWYHFNRDEVEVDELRKIKKTELIDFFKQYVNPVNEDGSLRKLSVHIVSTVEDKTALEKHSQKAKDAVDGKRANAGLITDLAEFKQSCGLYPLPKPLISKKKTA